jgi:cyclopropane fatty-acyl-phospholipid synthase-like methyltransferase
MAAEKNIAESLDHVNHVRKLISYFEDTKRDYRLWWMTSTALAMHFGLYDEHTRTHAEALINMNRVLATKAALHSSDRVLDAGCGVGGSAIWLARELGARVVGVNVVPSEIDRGRRYARQRNVADRVTFELQDMTRTAFPDGSFDVVWAIESVCHVLDKREFLAEARRLLKPGGRLVVAEAFRRRRPFGPADERLLHDWLSAWVVPDLMMPNEFTDAAEKSGFASVKFKDVTAHVRPSSRRMYRLACVLYPLGVARRMIGLFTDVQLANRRSALDQYRVVQRDLLVYGIITATRRDQPISVGPTEEP